MKNGQIHLWGGRIVKEYRMIGMTVIVFFMAACQPEEKQQRIAIPATDSLQEDQQIKDPSIPKEVFPGGDTIQQECQLIQGQAESLLEEYHQSKTTEVRQREILIELNLLEQKWKQMDCQQVFGYMIPPVSSPTGAGNSVPENRTVPK